MHWHKKHAISNDQNRSICKHTVPHQRDHNYDIIAQHACSILQLPNRMPGQVQIDLRTVCTCDQFCGINLSKKVHVQ